MLYYYRFTKYSGTRCWCSALVLVKVSAPEVVQTVAANRKQRLKRCSTFFGVMYLKSNLPLKSNYAVYASPDSRKWLLKMNPRSSSLIPSLSLSPSISPSVAVSLAPPSLVRVQQILLCSSTLMMGEDD